MSGGASSGKGGAPPSSAGANGAGTTGTAGSLSTPSDVPVVLPGWTLLWHDEYSGGSFDAAARNQSQPLGYYVYWSNIGADCWWNGQDGVSIHDGLASLSMTNNPVSQNGKTYHYTAGGVTAKVLVHYGRWIIRAKFAVGSGQQTYLSLWEVEPNPNNAPPEIDFAELAGNRPNEMVFVQHYGAPKAGGGYTYEYQNNDIHKETGTWNSWHEYDVAIAPSASGSGETVTYQIDGQPIYTTDNKYPEVSAWRLAIGTLVEGDCTGFAGCPDANTRFPSSLDIDYIRVYELGQ